jgi:hypothetical protein
MWQARVYTILARALSVMMCWVVLMGLPVLFFRPPLGPEDLKVFLGVFYALLLVVGTFLARAWDLKGLLLVAFPFFVLFTALGMRAWLAAGPAWQDKLPAMNFLIIYGVIFLAWRLGVKLRSNEA